MKIESSLSDVLHQQSQVRALRHLWKNRGEWGGRELARMVGMSASSCHEALKRLHDRGLVLFRRVANSHLYKYDEDNFLNQKVFAPLFEAEKTIPDEITKLIKRVLTGPSAKAEILSLSIFGSRARGTEKLYSDLDLAVVVPDKAAVKAAEEDLFELKTALHQRFSVNLSPYVNSLPDLKKKFADALPVVMNIIKEGRCIYGKKVEDLVR